MSEPNYGIGYDIPDDAAPRDLYEAEQIAALHDWKSFDEFKAFAGVTIRSEFFHTADLDARAYVAWIGEYVKFKKELKEELERFESLCREQAAGDERYRRRMKL